MKHERERERKREREKKRWRRWGMQWWFLAKGLEMIEMLPISLSLSLTLSHTHTDSMSNSFLCLLSALGTSWVPSYILHNNFTCVGLELNIIMDAWILVLCLATRVTRVMPLPSKNKGQNAHFFKYFNFTLNRTIVQIVCLARVSKSRDPLLPSKA